MKSADTARENFAPDAAPTVAGEAKQEYAFSGKGEVYSYTILRDAPAGYEDTTPYTVALVKLQEGPVITAQLTDLGDYLVSIGMPVEMVTWKIREVWDEHGMLVYGYKSTRLPVRVKPASIQKT